MEKYITQKAQKITSAIYLITDFIKDSDVIKWELREEGIVLVSNALMLNTTFPSDKEHAIKLFTTSADKIISFLKIAKTSFLISSMNANIVINEIESIVNFINKEGEEKQLPGYILSDTFFATDNDISLPNNNESKKDKGHQSLLKTNTQKDQSNQVKSERKQSREENIISLLKKDSNLTIKDFAKVIKDCSEKTIQRELISLVKKGLVKRAGERRWSTYSLA